MKQGIINIFLLSLVSLFLLNCGGMQFGSGSGVKSHNEDKKVEPQDPSSPSLPPVINPHIKTCEEDVSYCPTEQLCVGGYGKGRKIYVISGYGDLSFTNYVKGDLADIKEYTGIDYDFHIGTTFNSTELQNLNNNEYDAIWFISTEKTIPSDLLTVIKNKVQQGVGLVLLGDNGQYSSQVDYILKNTKPEWNLKFETNVYDKGMQLVAKGNSGSKILYEHLVTSGLYKDVSEGNTISYLLPRDSSKPSIIKDTNKFKPIILNSSSHISVAAVEEELSNGVSGYSRVKMKNDKIIQRTLMHGGFTSLFRTYDKWAWKGKDSSTPLFFYNIACWSSGSY